MLRIRLMLHCSCHTGDIIKLLDEKLPEGWEKKAKFKTSASKAGKWDVVIIG